jgi:hypothetical protein
MARVNIASTAPLDAQRDLPLAFAPRPQCGIERARRGQITHGQFTKITTLHASQDATNLDRGSYELAIRRHGED